tara:strand:- start:611 stop:1288 length:678 start_codon:yes stop_codon:yes gene_type:complete
MVLGQILALILSGIDYITEGKFSENSLAKTKFISFAGGISISYMVLILLPEVYSGAIKINQLLYLSVLAGFGTFHIIEKYIRLRYSYIKYKRHHDLIHTIISFIYFLIVGFVLVKLIDTNIITGFLFFIPILFHIVIDSIPKKISKKPFLKILIASSPLLGALVATFISVTEAVMIALLGIISGVLLYTVTRESIPKEREGKPIFFLIGLLLFTVLILIIWNVKF